MDELSSRRSLDSCQRTKKQTQFSNSDDICIHKSLAIPGVLLCHHDLMH